MDFLQNRNDLAALKPPKSEDMLSRLLLDHWIFQKHSPSDSIDRTTFYAGKTVARTVSVISVVVAAILVVVAIASLYVVSNDAAKLGMVAAYTLLFAASTALMTTASRAEVYASTAAYAAVLVVYVSGDLGQGDQCMMQVAEGMFKSAACPS
jgi:hypothetical protein